MMCELPVDLTQSMFLPVMAISFLAFAVTAVVTNLLHGRGYADVRLTDMDTMKPLDRRLTKVAVSLFAVPFLLNALYAAITWAVSKVAGWVGLCDTGAASAALWPPAVVFGVCGVAGWAALRAELSQPQRAVAGSAAWGFFSLAVGLAVSVFWADPAVIVVASLVATLLPTVLLVLRLRWPGAH